MASKLAFKELVDYVEKEVIWELGADHAWESDCIIGADFLAALISLAVLAPVKERRLFLSGHLVVEIDKES